VRAASPCSRRQPKLFEARVGVLRFLLRQAHPGGVDTIMLGSVGQERAPAAAHIEQLHARFEPELLADAVELAPLRAVEGLPALREERAGVRHALAEEALEEIVSA